VEKIRRVVFCTYPCLYSSIVLNELLRAPNVEVVAVIASTRNLKTKEIKLVSDLIRIKNSGIAYALYLLFITEGFKLFPALFPNKSIAATCKVNAISLIQTQNINTTELQAEIKLLKPDVICCAHFNQLIHPKTYNLAKEAAINMHPSLLPDLKGADPAFNALTDNYGETGVTIHHLAEEFDTGEIISQHKQEITQSETLLSLNKKLFQSGSKLFVEYLASNLNTTAIITSNDSDRYDSWPSKLQIKKFKQTRNFIFPRKLFR
jgi:methionyl-tRNA formyltransferase